MTTTPDALTLEQVAARIERIMWITGVLGTCVALAIGGWRSGAGFLVGAGISGLNFHWLHKLVEGLGGTPRPRSRSVILGFRYLILGIAAYVIVRVSQISLKALLAGLFVLTGAIFVETGFEIVHYARKRTVDHEDL